MILKLLGISADVLALVTTVTSLGAYIYSRRVNKRMQDELTKQDERISIYLTDLTQTIFVGHPRRKWLTRSELNGLLGLIPMKPVETEKGTNKQPRYSLPSVNWMALYDQLENTQDGENNTLTINCSEVDMEQFIDDMKK